MMLNNKQITIIATSAIIGFFLMMGLIAAANMKIRFEMDDNTKESVFVLNNTIQSVYSIADKNYECEKNLSICEYALSDCQFNEDYKIKPYIECLYLDDEENFLYCAVRDGEVDCFLSNIGVSKDCEREMGNH